MTTQTPLMAWNEARKQWTKRNPKGCGAESFKMEFLGPRRLTKSPFGYMVKAWTPSGTAAAANAWWKDHEAQLRREASTAVDRKRAEALSTIGALIHEGYEATLTEIASRTNQTGNVGALLVSDLFDAVATDNPNANFDAMPVDGQRLMLDSIAKVTGKSPTAPTASLSATAKAYFADLDFRMRHGATVDRPVSSTHIRRVRFAVSRFVDAVGNMPLASLTVAHLGNYYKSLAGESLSTESKKGYWNNVKGFLRWCVAEQKPINAGLVLWAGSKGFKKNGCNATRSFSPDDLRAVLNAIDARREALRASGSRRRDLVALAQLKASILLRVNCGTLTEDQAALTFGEVAGDSLSYKRHKTENHEHLGKVTFPIWAATRKALDELQAVSGRSSGLVFQSHNGSPIIRDDVDEAGNGSRSDCLGLNFTRLRRWAVAEGHAFPSLPLKNFRKVFSTEAERLEIAPKYINTFLGHAGESMADKHYKDQTRATDWDRFADAVRTVGKSLGLD
jgi:integrase